MKEKCELDSELEEKVEMIKKMLMNWKVVITADRREGGMCREVYERKKDNLEECEDFIQDISEEVQRIEEGKTTEGIVEDTINWLIYRIRGYIEQEEEYRNRGEIDCARYWENVLKVVMKARLRENWEEPEEME